MRLPGDIRRKFQEHGRRGGAERSRRLSPGARAAIARRAALKRWTAVRFGATSFAALQLPGGELIDAGVDDLVSGKETVESLLVSLAAPRLRRENVPLPSATLSDPDNRLYRLLERSEGDLAHSRYLAYLRRVSSFADACHAYSTGRSRRAR
jgi:hypothetical protein